MNEKVPAKQVSNRRPLTLSQMATTYNLFGVFQELPALQRLSWPCGRVHAARVHRWPQLCGSHELETRGKNGSISSSKT